MKSSKLPDILKSPSNGAIKRESISFAKEERQMKEKPRQIRTSYIARKINQDDICDSSMKQSSALLQIKEEKIESIEEASEGQSELDIAFDTNKSIFQASGFASSKYKEPTKGPAYNKGQIIRHSIVGSIEGYEKAQQSVEKAQRIKALGTFEQDSNNNSTADRRFSRAPSSMNSIDEGSGNSRTGTAQSFAVKKALLKGKAKEAKEVKITKGDLLKKFVELKENEHKFYQVEARRYSNLSYGERLHYTRDERCLQKFDEANETWDKNISKITQRVGKGLENSVMMRSGHFREKVEVANILEAGKTIHERFGPRLWPETLRRDIPNVSRRNNSVMESVPLGFSMLDPIEPKTPLELIRTPLRATMSSFDSTKEFSQTKLMDRTSEEYLNSKISKLGKLLASIKPSNTTQTNSLIVYNIKAIELTNM